MTILDVEVVFQLAPRYATILARQLQYAFTTSDGCL